MADLTLGLDVGSNSVGWALLDEIAGSIVAVGVRVFPEGVARDQQGGEKSKNQDRRTARTMRRQIRRRAQRRRQLRQYLASAGLFPTDPQEQEALMKKDPYELRRRAVAEKVHPHELGRALLHLAQRRGYLSNRKTDRATDKDQKGLLAEIGELGKMLAAQKLTLGEYLAERMDDARRSGAACDRIRGKHTLRAMYEAEFEAIWSAQQAHYHKVLTDALKYGKRNKQRFPKKPEPIRRDTNLLAEYGVHGLIFFQRAMYWPRSVVGRCELERKEKRCPRAARLAQRFRLVQEVNNLRLLDRDAGVERRLDEQERAILVEYLSQSKERSFEQIRAELNLSSAVRFNLERGERPKLKGHETDAAMAGKNGLGKAWKDLPDATKDAIVDVLIQEDQEEKVLDRLTKECGLSDEHAQRAVRVPLADGYLSYSRKAIARLLPHMEHGLLLMGDDAENSAIHAAGYVRPDQREPNQREFLPRSPDLTNPIVRQAMVEVRKVVNGVLREYVYRKGHRLGRIHVELARDAKNSFRRRKEITDEIAERRRLREAVAAEIEAFDPEIKRSRATVNRYLLWKEQNKMCVYCGKNIGQAELFNGEADIDHILPRWRSLDDSLANKVVAHVACNREKGDRTPREWLEESDPARYERVQRAAAALPYNKQLRFHQKDIQLTDFVERQLRDTAYISTCVSQYLRCLGAAVACPRGQMTHDLREWWGLNSILRSDDSDEKNRADHRHHAIDAVVLALTDTKRLFALANARGRNMPPPWPRFRDQVESAVLAICVSHRAQRRLHGALHEDTLYGATTKGEKDENHGKRPWAKGWIEDEHVFVRRKPLTDLTEVKQLAKVRDETIRQILCEHLRRQGIDPEKPGRIPGDAFKGGNAPHMASGVPIYRVRMLESSETIRCVSQSQPTRYIKPGSNHHVEIFDVIDEEGRPVLQPDGQVKRGAVFVSMLDAAARVRGGLSLVNRDLGTGKRFAMSLCINDMFLLELPNGSKVLHRVQKLSEGSIILRPHTYAGKVSDRDKPPLIQRRTPNTLRGEKVVVDPLGHIRHTND